MYEAQNDCGGFAGGIGSNFPFNHLWPLVVGGGGMSDFGKGYVPEPTKPAPMTKDEALDLALASLENWKCVYPEEWDAFDEEAITAIKQALAAPVQKRPQNCGTGYCSCIECVMEPAPVQEPVAWGIIASNTGRICQVELDADEIEGHNPKHIVPLYTTPPAAQPAPVEPLEYWNAVEGWVKIDEVREHFDSVGCGTIYKTAGDGRVPLTAAQPAPVQEPVAWIHVMDNTEGIKRNGKGIVSITQKRKHPFGKPGVDFSKSYPVTSTPLYTTPPAQPAPEVCCGEYKTCLKPCTPRGEFLAAQRQWAGLTDEEMDELVKRFARYELARATENLLRSKNT